VALEVDQSVRLHDDDAMNPPESRPHGEP